MTRHNTGFVMVDLLAHHFALTWENKSRFQGSIAKGLIFGSPVVLLKPATFMNLSGKSVASCLGYFQLATNETIVLHDELDCPFGQVKVRMGGGAGGHNGIKSLIQESGGKQDFLRLKLGIGRPVNEKMDISDWVLSSMTEEELDVLKNQMFPLVLERLAGLLTHK
jgi:PTH1 family peptidyl-tRNA hydrolase